MEKIKLTAGVFILLVLTGGITYYIAEGDTVYYCEDKNIVGICWKLSKINDAGTQTRCYYNESASTRYKQCKTGWIEFTEGIIGNVSDTDSIGFDIDLGNKTIILKSLGIGKFEIRNQSCKIYNETFNNKTNETIIGECLEIDNSFLGYDQPIIRPCNKINDFECKAKVYQKNGINRPFIIITKYCIEYNVTEIEGVNVTGECINWKILNKDEINLEGIKYAEEEFERIYQITLQRQNRTSILLSDEIILNIE